jgi:hypothetical protein
MPEIVRRKLGENRVRAAVDVTSFNETDRTVEVVFATEAEVVRYGWDGKFIEVLDCNTTSVRLERLNSGAPVLDNHSAYSLTNQIGVVVRAWVTANECRALLRFSDRDDIAGIISDIKNGIIRNVSVGYRVYTYEQSEQVKDEVPTYRALDWEPMEISMVPIPADYNAGTRNDGGFYEVQIISKEKSNTTMPEESKERGAEQQPPYPPAAAPAAPPVDMEAVRSEGVKAERQRVTDIRGAVRAAKLEDNFADDLISRGVAIEEARRLIIDKLAETEPVETRGTHVPRVGAGGVDEAVQNRTAMEEALAHRADPSNFKLESDKAKDYRGHSLTDFCRSVLDAQGVKTTGMTKDELASRALTTSDFPALMANVVNKFLRRAYSAAPQTWKKLANQMSASDFKQITGVQFGGSLKLEKVNEHGEFKYGKLTDSKENFKLETYGKIISITRQAIINDDLNGFTRLSQLFGAAAANLESDIMWGLILGNPKMGDGKTLFHADHKNLAAAGGAISETTLSAARIAMMRQKGLEDEALNILAKYFIVPVELMTDAQKIMSSITANKTGDVNVFNGAYEIITEARITDPKAWYLAADSAQVDMLSYAYLNGQGLFTETRNGWEVDGVEVKARLDFGGVCWDHRGFYKNPGA